MCMVIDVNTISCVLSSKNEKHKLFLPVLKWFLYGKAKICLGGKLEDEYNNLLSYQPLFKEFAKFNKIHKIGESLIKGKENEIIEIEKDRDFDDPHIIALIIVSRAKVLCSDDSRSFKYVHRIKEYDKRAIIPKIYTTSNKHLLPTKVLCDKNICCNGDHITLDKRIADYFFKRIEG